MNPHSVTLNDDVSHGYTLCTSQLLWISWLHTMPPSMIMYPMDLHHVPLNDDGYHGSTLCPTHQCWLPWLYNMYHTLVMAPIAPSNTPPPQGLWIPHNEEEP